MSLVLGGATVAATTIGVAGYFYYYIINGYAKPYQPKVNSLHGKTIVITGATTGLGLESAKRLAIGGANIIITARTESKGQNAVNEINKFIISLQKKHNNTTDNTHQQQEQIIQYKVIDFCDLQTMKINIQNNWDDVTTIDVLLNNAGAFFNERILTIDGYESTIQANHLGHFVLTALLYPKLTNNARIVNVSSAAHLFVTNGLNFDNLWQGKHPNFSPFYAYSESKMANILFTKELQRRIDASNEESSSSLSITTVSLHPGAVTTELGRSGNGTVLGWCITKIFNLLASIGIAKTVSNGSATQVWLCSIPIITNEMKGKYYVDCTVTETLTIPTETTDAIRLWNESEQKGGVTFSFDRRTNTSNNVD